MGNKFRYTFYLRIVKGILLSPLALLFPRNNRKMVFGAWGGENFSDNPKYFMKFMLSVPGWNCIWIGQERLRSQVCSIKGVRFVRKGSLLALWHCLTAKYFVNNVIWMDDIMDIPTFGRVIQINLWHGTALKRIGRRQYNGNGAIVAQGDGRSAFRKWYSMMMLRIYDYMYPMRAYSSTGSKKNAVVMQESWPQIFNLNRMALAGQPRCDFLLAHLGNKPFIKSLKVKFAKMLGIPLNRRWYLYLPTWRHDFTKIYSFAVKGRNSRLDHILERNKAIIIEKQHPKVLQVLKNEVVSSHNVLAITEEQANLIDVQELLLVADRLVTDYSSCYFDYELLRRPIIHFDYDCEHYVNSDSGVEYDPREVAGGPVVFTENELLDALALRDDELLSKKGAFANELIDLETGHSGKSLYEMLPR